jgi:outer membrane lipoprotein-sorting protein
VNAKTKQKLEKALAKVMDYEVASGDFKQTKSIKKRNRNFVTTGTFRISKKNGISWNTKKPIVSELALNNGGIFERDANGQTRMILPKDNPIFADLSKNIQALFSGKVSELETKFQVFYETKSCGFTMGLVPREGMLRMVVANIVIEACKNIDKAVITDGENSPMTFEFMNYKIIGKTSPNQEDVTP